MTIKIPKCDFDALPVIQLPVDGFPQIVARSGEHLSVESIDGELAQCRPAHLVFDYAPATEARLRAEREARRIAGEVLPGAENISGIISGRRMHQRPSRVR